MSTEGPPEPPLGLARLQRILRPVLVVIPALGLTLGFGIGSLGLQAWSGAVWFATTVPVLLTLLAEIATSLRRGDVGLDIVAALSMTVALLFQENLAAVVVALMYAGGQYLESYAERRAGREMTALLSRVPRAALRRRNGGLEEVALELVLPGDRLLIGRGAVVPVDGVVAAGIAVLDQAALTGEPLPVKRCVGEEVLSGSTNAGDAFELAASRRAAESTYAGIIRLVEAAQHAKAPMVRLADRFAILFLFVTAALAGGAWLWTGDPIRMLAVLVVATPCPLILAVPVALVSGVSRAARAGVLVKGGKALEALARVTTMVIDKTGTLTYGQARLVAVRPQPGFDEDTLLCLGASLEQASSHVIARAIVAAALERSLRLAAPSDVRETPGEGLEGRVNGRTVVIGATRFVAERVEGVSTPSLGERVASGVVVAIAVDGRFAGVLLLADELRQGAGEILAELRASGVDRIVLATGDRRDIAVGVGAALPLDAIRSELDPQDKVAVVLGERRRGPVMMVGDGVNDAPALAAADVGVAMGANGAAASAQAADVVLLVDRLDRLLSAIRTARRSCRIGLQSVYAGIGLSVAGMIAAALGHLTPVQGALLQEAIDVAVILNALRALSDGRFSGRGASPRRGL